MPSGWGHWPGQIREKGGGWKEACFMALSHPGRPSEGCGLCFLLITQTDLLDNLLLPWHRIVQKPSSSLRMNS